MSYKKKVFGSQRYYRSSDSHGKRQLRYILLAVFLGIILAVAFGAVLYCINMQGRI